MTPDYYIKKYERLKAEKTPWLNEWSKAAKYVRQLKRQGVHGTTTSGHPLADNLYDDIAARSNATMASALIGSMWPNGAKSIVVDPHDYLSDSDIMDKAAVKEFFLFQTRRLTQLMDDPKTGLLTSIEEYMLDQGAFGTSGIGVFERPGDLFHPFQVKAYDCLSSCIDETADGFVDTVYTELEMPIESAAKEYGLENLSPKCRRLYGENKGNTKVRLLHCVEPRSLVPSKKKTILDAPIVSVTLEIETKHVIRQSGYWKMPISMGRFWKGTGEKYGRSPTSIAMPSIEELDGCREAFIYNVDLSNHPPQAVWDDGSFGGETIDLSPHAINVFTLTSRAMNMNPRDAIVELTRGGDPKTLLVRIQELGESITTHYFIDRLLDFNNQTQMTFGETQLRNQLRSESLLTTYSRQKAEVFLPMSERCYDIAFRAGLLGVMPGSVEQEQLEQAGLPVRLIPEELHKFVESGAPFHKIRFISPASRMMRKDELNGLNLVLQAAPVMQQLNPDALDTVDFDQLFWKYMELVGAPPEVPRDTVSVASIRKGRQRAIEDARQAEAEKTGAEIMRNQAQAAQMMNQR